LTSAAVNPFSGRVGDALSGALQKVEERLLPRMQPTLSSSLIVRCQEG
jgi:hypothetical protein